MQVFGTLVAWVVLVGVLLIWVPLTAVLWVVTRPFDPTLRLVGRNVRNAAVAVAAGCPLWRMRTEGYELAREHPYVVVANHESNIDPFLLSCLPWEMKWVAKESLFKIPFLGWLFGLAGDIPIRRGDKDSTAVVLARAKWYLERGMSVMLFPEGTRSRTDELLPFKAGAFRLAIETGRPILPIVIRGTGAALPKGSPWLRHASPKARVLPPVPVAGLSVEAANELADRVRQMIQEGRRELIRSETAA